MTVQDFSYCACITITKDYNTYMLSLCTLLHCVHEKCLQTDRKHLEMYGRKVFVLKNKAFCGSRLLLLAVEKTLIAGTAVAGMQR